jgi:hypothetical protein
MNFEKEEDWHWQFQIDLQIFKSHPASPSWILIPMPYLYIDFNTTLNWRRKQADLRCHIVANYTRGNGWKMAAIFSRVLESHRRDWISQATL